MAARPVGGKVDILRLGDDDQGACDEPEDVCIASELRLVHRLLWNEIESRVPVSERDEVRSP